MRDMLKRLLGTMMICTFGFTGNASAVVIDFDDLIPVIDPVFSCFCDNPLTDEYASQGLMFNDGFFYGESVDGGLTYENVLVTGPYGQLIFVGEHPTFVSMLVTSIHNDAIYLSAYGPDGFIETKKTPGFGGPLDDTPPVPNFLVSFYSETGISFINIDAFFFRRTGAEIDDLTFTYTSVPEPSPLLLMSLAGVFFLRRYFQKKQD